MKNRSTIFKISFTGIMLSLVILFQFLEQFMPFIPGLVNFNFSIVFIFATAFISGMPYGFLLLILRFAIGPALSGGYGNVYTLIGHIILFVAGVLTLSLFWFATMITKLDKLWKYIVVALVITLSVSFLMSLLNATLFTRWFFNGDWTIPDWERTYSIYDSSQALFFGIDNYWWGNIAVFTTFNIINLSIVFIINYPLSKVVKRFSISTQSK